MHTVVPASTDTSDGHETESADDRKNRQLVELLNELRVVLPGVQMLFGFLLAVPFTQRFSTISDLQSNVYYGTFLAATAASVFLIAPASFHRIVWRHGRKRQLLQVSNKLAIIGTALPGGCDRGIGRPRHQPAVRQHLGGRRRRVRGRADRGGLVCAAVRLAAAGSAARGAPARLTDRLDPNPVEWSQRGSRDRRH